MGWSIGSWGGCKFSFPFRSPEGISHAVRAFSLLLAGGALARIPLSVGCAALRAPHPFPLAAGPLQNNDYQGVTRPEAAISGIIDIFGW